jgi:hypothetical protein
MRWLQNCASEPYDRLVTDLASISAVALEPHRTPSQIWCAPTASNCACGIAVGMFIGGWLAPLALKPSFWRWLPLAVAAGAGSCWRIMAQPARCRAVSVRKKTSMQTNLLNTKPADGLAAEAILQNVHCGFCTATCPTYQLPDELDGLRGRIYLIKQCWKSS